MRIFFCRAKALSVPAHEKCVRRRKRGGKVAGSRHIADSIRQYQLQYNSLNDLYSVFVPALVAACFIARIQSPRLQQLP